MTTPLPTRYVHRKPLKVFYGAYMQQQQKTYGPTYDGRQSNGAPDNDFPEYEAPLRHDLLPSEAHYQNVQKINRWYDTGVDGLGQAPVEGRYDADILGGGRLDTVLDGDNSTYVRQGMQTRQLRADRWYQRSIGSIFLRIEDDALTADEVPLNIGPPKLICNVYCVAYPGGPRLTQLPIPHSQAFTAKPWQMVTELDQGTRSWEWRPGSGVGDRGAIPRPGITPTRTGTLNEMLASFQTIRDPSRAEFMRRINGNLTFGFGNANRQASSSRDTNPSAWDNRYFRTYNEEFFIVEVEVYREWTTFDPPAVDSPYVYTVPCDSDVKLEQITGSLSRSVLVSIDGQKGEPPAPFTDAFLLPAGAPGASVYELEDVARDTKITLAFAAEGDDGAGYMGTEFSDVGGEVYRTDIAWRIAPPEPAPGTTGTQVSRSTVFGGASGASGFTSEGVGQTTWNYGLHAANGDIAVSDPLGGYVTGPQPGVGNGSVPAGDPRAWVDHFNGVQDWYLLYGGTAGFGQIGKTRLRVPPDNAVLQGTASPSPQSAVYQKNDGTTETISVTRGSWSLLKVTLDAIGPSADFTVDSVEVVVTYTGSFRPSVVWGWHSGGPHETKMLRHFTVESDDGSMMVLRPRLDSPDAEALTAARVLAFITQGKIEKAIGVALSGTTTVQIRRSWRRTTEAPEPEPELPASTTRIYTKCARVDSLQPPPFIPLGDLNGRLRGHDIAYE